MSPGRCVRLPQAGPHQRPPPDSHSVAWVDYAITRPPIPSHFLVPSNPSIQKYLPITLNKTLATNWRCIYNAPYLSSRYIIAHSSSIKKVSLGPNSILPYTTPRYRPYSHWLSRHVWPSRVGIPSLLYLPGQGCGFSIFLRHNHGISFCSSLQSSAERRLRLTLPGPPPELYFL